MPRVEVVGEMNMNWEFGLGRCKLLQLQRVKNKVLLCSSWNYIDYFVINHKGKEYKKNVYMSITESLCCTTEIGTLEITYQFRSVAQLCPTLCNPMDCSTRVLPVHNQLPELIQTHVHWVGDAIQPSHPPSSPSLLCSIFPIIRVFSNESVLRIRWPKYWSFSFNISPSNEHSGLISFRMDWFDLLAIQGTLKSLLQHHSSKASFFSAQLSL